MLSDMFCFIYYLIVFYIYRGEIDTEPPFQREKIDVKDIDHNHFHGQIILLVRDEKKDEKVYEFNFDEKDPQTAYYLKKATQFRNDEDFGGSKNKLEGTKCLCMLMQQIDSNKTTNEQCVNHKVKLNNI